MNLLLFAVLGCSDPGAKDTGDTGGDTATGDTSGDSGDTSGDSGDTSGDSGDTSGDSGDTSGDSGGDTGLPDGLHGQAPDERIPAPKFAVLNQDRETRTRDDLMGHPTVVWFYPAAATGG